MSQREAELGRLNRSLKALRHMSRAMLRAEGEEEFLREVCRVLVEECNHAMVWVGYAEEDEGKSVRPVAWWGFEEGYLETMKITWGEGERGRGPTGTAIRTGKPAFCRDMRTDPQFAPWRMAAVKRGYASSLVLPLMKEGKAFGAVTVYFREPDPFTEEEIDFFRDLAEDISQGIETVRIREARGRAEAALRESENRYRGIVETAEEGIATHMPDGTITYVNQRMAAMLGYAREELIGKNSLDFVEEEDREGLIQGRQQTKEQGSFNRERKLRRKDGSTLWTLVNVSPQRDLEGHFFGYLAMHTDITRRKLGEQSLRQSELRYRMLHESLRDAFVQVAMDGRIIEFNEAYCRMLGYTPEEVRRLTYQELTPERWQSFEERIVLEQIIPRGYSDVYQKEYRRKDGSIFPVELRTVLSRDEAGKPISMWGIIRDITERKRVEEALRESQALLRAVTDNSPDAIYVKDRESRWLMANPAVLRIVGKTAAEALGKTDMELYVDPEIGKEIVENDQNVLALGKALTFEEVADTPEGRRVFLSTKAPRHDEKGQVIGVIGISRDITNRKCAEAALRESEEALRKLNAELEGRVRERTAEAVQAAANAQAERKWFYDVLETLPAMICLLTPDYHVAFANRSFRDWFGEVQGRCCFEVCFGKEKPCEFCESFEPLKTGRPHYWEVACPNGRVVDAYDFPFSDADGSTLILEMAIDVTAWRRAEAELRTLNETLEARVAERTAELARSNKELEAFAYVASHDLQEPLRMVSAFMKLLETRCAPQLDKNGKEYIAFAVDGAKRMSELINDLLAYSRVERKGGEIVPVETADVLAGVLANLRMAVEEAGAKVTHDEMPVVAADRGQLRQVFQNLIGNALKFRAAGRACEVNVGVRRQDDAWEFEVRDNGIGIDSQQSERIFQIFQRLHTRDRYPGTGIGLAICKKIVERHGGKIWVESKAGEGATFRFTIPMGEWGAGR